LLHPHSSIPYVQMGRSIALCTVSLLSRDSCERAFISRLILKGEYGLFEKIISAGERTTIPRSSGM